MWRNWIAHQTSNLGVAGSSPVVGKIVFLILLCLMSTYMNIFKFSLIKFENGYLNNFDLLKVNTIVKLPESGQRGAT